jgi:hypothetical protein
MILNLFPNKPQTEPEDPLAHVPKRAFRNGWINRRYPQGPHQSSKEKLRRLKRLMKERTRDEEAA